MPTTYDWTPEQCSSDLVRLLDELGIDQVHLVAAKYGGTIAMQLAGEFPDRVTSLSIFSSPATGLVTDAAERVQASSVRTWADETQRSRLGHTAPEAQVRWWTDELMGKSDPRAVIGSNHAIRASNVTAWLGHISAPTLIVTTENSGLQSVETARRYQVLIPNSRLEVMAGDHYHAAAVEPERCAEMVLELIEDSPSK
jgi:3-oxoadipate enol-lactonase/4-carboxymuconolactone decarboxylase